MSLMSSQAGTFPDQPQIERDPIQWALHENDLTWYRDLVEHSGDLLCIHDLQGRLLSVNPVPARLLGYSVEEMLQIPMREMIVPEYRDLFDQYLKQIEGEGEAQGLMVVLSRSGERRVWEFHNTLQTTHAGAPIVLGLARDITEKRQAEAKFQELLEAAPDAMVVTDREARITLLNAQVERTFGYAREELLGQRIEILMPERLRERYIELRNDFLRAAHEMPMGKGREFLGLHKDGREFAVEMILSPLQTAQGLLVASTIRDITQRKLAEDRIRQYEKAMEGLEEMIAVVDRNYRYVSANQAFLKYRGLESVQLVGRNIGEVLDKVIFETVVKEKLDEALRGNIVRYEMKYQYPELGERDLSISYFPIEERGQIDRVACVLRDITERKRAAEDLEASEEWLRLAQEVAKIGAFERNLLSGEFRWSPEMKAMFGLPPGGAPRSIEAFLDLVHREDRSNVARLIEQSMQTGDAQGEWRAIWPDGSEHWIAGRWRIFKDEHGTPVRILGMDYDITARKQAEEALRTSERKQHKIAEQLETERARLIEAQAVAKVGSWETELPSLEITWSEQTHRIFETDPSYFHPRRPAFMELVHPEDRAKVDAAFEASLEKGAPSTVEYRIVMADGRVKVLEEHWKVFHEEPGRPARLTGTCHDITERKKAEACLREAVEELRLAKEKLNEEKVYLEQAIDTELGFEEIVGNSVALKEVMEQVGKVAASDATALLLGETGTGKELVARALHRLSLRAGNSFIKMNCAAIPSGLLESELFGYEKGAFTGATGRKLGRLELADKGTLFLDEIGEIPLALQPKLLRVLQDQEFERLGGTETLKVDFRLIAATNRNLAESVRKKEFRSDLYYRLHVFPVRVPPLRERREDIPLLLEHFVKKCAKRMNKKITSIPKRTIDALMRWDWPGNVRELENFVERSVILTHGSALESPLSELQPASEVGDNETLEDAQRERILRALRDSHGQIGGPSGAAARLGLKRTTLQSKLKQMRINRHPPMARY